MSNLFIVVKGNPTIVFYKGDKPTGYDLLHSSLDSIGEIFSQLRVTGGDNSNTKAILDNGRNHLSEYFHEAPIGTEVEVYKNNSLIWRGVINRVRISNTIELDLQA